MEERQNPPRDIFLAAVLDQVGTNFYITDIETDEILYIDKTMKGAFGLTRPEGRVCWQVLQRDVEKRCPYYKIRQAEQVRDNEICVWRETNSVTGKKYRSYGSPIRWEGRICHIQNSMDVTEYDKISETAHIDELTRMLNRQGGSKRLMRALEQGSRESQVVTAVLYDINELKSVNDRYGHSEGDRLLQCVTAIAKERLERLDFMYRLSGDEFAMALYGWGMKAVGESIKRLLTRAEWERKRQLQEHDASFSYEIAEVCSRDMDSVKNIISRADGRMYIQKREYYIERAKRRLREKHEDGDALFYYNDGSLYEALSVSTNGYIFVEDMKTGVFYYPQAVVGEFGLPDQVVREIAAFWGQLVHPRDEAHSLESNQSIADGRREHHNIEHRTRNVRGEWTRLRCRGEMLRDKDGQPKLFTGMISNLGREDQIGHMTGLYNKYEFEENIEEYLADRKCIDTIDLMVLDMDSFKNIDGLYDRPFGDEVLWTTAQKVASMLPPNAMLHRLDGGEFSTLFLGEDTEEAAHLSDKLQQNFCKQQGYGGEKYSCIPSTGYAAYPEDGGDYPELFRRTNYSLEYFRIMGKSRVTVFSGNTLVGRERRLELMELLHESVGRGFAGFSTHYQSQAGTLSGRLCGVEALTRWYCGEYRGVPPGEFILLMKQGGLIVPLGQQILSHGMTQCLEWYRSRPDFQISMNLSCLQPSQRDFISPPKTAPEENSLDPFRFIMELTEIYLAKAEVDTFRLIVQIKELGVEIAMGDFEVGYSSLFSLKGIPVDTARIGRRFVKGATSDSFNAAFARSITDLCRSVGRKVCLEGVETKEEYEAVRELRMKCIQGYCLGHPMNAQRFEDRLKE